MKTLPANLLAPFFGCEIEITKGGQGLHEINGDMLKDIEHGHIQGKPVLRKLDLMTKEEATEIAIIWGIQPHLMTYEIESILDAFKNTEENVQLALGEIMVNLEMFWQTSSYLMQKGFDLYCWIDQDLAINQLDNK